MYVESDGEDVGIYVLDTGIKIDHEDFGGRFVTYKLVTISISPFTSSTGV